MVDGWPWPYRHGSGGDGKMCEQKRNNNRKSEHTKQQHNNTDLRWHNA
jgi:hypothetical protein